MESNVQKKMFVALLTIMFRKDCNSTISCHFKPTEHKAHSYFLLTRNKNSMNIATSFKYAIENFALGFSRCCFERAKIQEFDRLSSLWNIKRIHIFSPPGIKIPLISLPRFNISSCQMPHLILVQIGVSLIIETD